MDSHGMRIFPVAIRSYKIVSTVQYQKWAVNISSNESYAASIFNWP